ncbi:MAG: lipoate--protein ligase [Candidatus Cryptobacteroides sp.]
MYYIELNSTNPHYNMAFEAWCLKNLPEGESYFYLWKNAPAVIIGENQNAYAEVNLDYLSANGVCLARRTTGGGAVYHDLNNLNYSFIGEDVSAQPMVDALQSLGVPAQLTGRNDIFVDGHKVSGYARRVECGRELVHGTLLFDVDLGALQKALDTPLSKMKAKGVKSVRSVVANLKDYLPQCVDADAFKQALLDYFAPQLQPYRLSEEQLARIDALCSSKFATREWNLGKSPEATFFHKAKFACGTVEVEVLINSGIIEQIGFAGDFLGSRSALELAEKLRGLPFDRPVVADALKKEGVENYFDALSAEDLLPLIFED